MKRDKRKYILILTGFCVLVATAFFLKKEETRSTVPVLTSRKPEKSFTEKQPVSQSEEGSDLRPTADEENVDYDQDDHLWEKKSDSTEADWNKEILTHIQYLDRENADEVYRSYLSARKAYLEEVQNLSTAVKDISRLNGESISSEFDPDPETQHEEFVTKLQSIFKEHYKYIESHRRIFLNNNPTGP